MRGQCNCGAVSWQSEADMIWQSYCHCEGCRRATSSPVAAWFCLPRASVEWEGPLQLYQSDDETTRGFCAKCGTPLYYHTERRPDELDLFALTLVDPSIYQPDAHYFYAQKLPWFEVKDDLPKYLGGDGSEIFKG